MTIGSMVPPSEEMSIYHNDPRTTSVQNILSKSKESLGNPLLK